MRRSPRADKLDYRAAEIAVVAGVQLDVDGNNLLTFEEWAVTTSNRFKAADANGDGELTQAEFAATAPKPVKKPACRC